MCYSLDEMKSGIASEQKTLLNKWIREIYMTKIKDFSWFPKSSKPHGGI